MLLKRRWRKVRFRRLHVLILILVAISTSLFLLTSVQFQTQKQDLVSHHYFRFNLSSEPLEDPSQSCVIPKLHPFHPSIWRYLVPTRPIVCKIRVPMLTYVDQAGYLKVNQTAFDSAGYSLADGSFMTRLDCVWKPVIRAGPGGVNDNAITYGKESPLTLQGLPLTNDDVITVICRNFAGLVVYDYVHSHVRNVSRFDVLGETNSPTNVLIFGIDSMSRQAFIRLLPKTYRYLTETLPMTIFSGMNKVGDNTFPNLIALLTGKKAYGPELPKEYQLFDDWPLVWKNYSDAGYVTLWAEDFPDFGLFNYLAQGFKVPPVDHYLRPFWLAVKESGTLRTSSHMCYNDQPRHQLQLKYVQRFIQKYGHAAVSRVPYFAFSFLAELSHEYQAKVAAADDDFEAFFRWLSDKSFVNETMLIVMSDHGHRFDPIRSTQVGRLEERLPFFAIHVPPKWVVTQPWIKQQLNINRGRLTTPYDIHATLIDVLLHLRNQEPLGFYNDANGYGRTLLGPIPANRTCKDAGIPAHYCTCVPETPISVGDIRVRAAVRAIFKRINKLLRTVRDFCTELLPGSVVNAQQMVHNSGSDATKQQRTRIRVSVEAVPSGAIFEATVEVKEVGVSKNKKITSRSSLPYEAKVLGDVSRINKYGNQSSCIKHDILRKYCFCQTKTPKPVFKLEHTVRGF